MAKIDPYKRISAALQNEAFEPMFAWGLRMALAAAVPVIWGLATHHLEPATWIALTAEAICWVELKGTFGQRMRVLLGGTFLALFFAVLGSVTGMSIWLSTFCMLGVAFLSSLFKNLGDRGSGLSICVYLLFIICNAYPVDTIHGLETRSLLVLLGASWTVVISLLISVFMPARQPYRRSVALIWRDISELVGTICKGWDGKGPRSTIREIYVKEKELRNTIDSSFTFHTATVQQVSKKDKHEYQLAQLRKATALIGAHMIAISGELETVNTKSIETTLQLKISALLNAFQQAADRMAIYVLTLKPEEELLLVSRISRLNNLIRLLKEYKVKDDAALNATEQRVIQLSERSMKLFESCMARLKEMGEDLPVFRSYSLYKTVYTLHPKHWIKNLQLLFNFNTFTTRYALRAAVAAAVALFIYKWYHIDHGYWLPFSVMIVLQPYFGATFKKAVQRITGTLVGGLVGGLLLHVHTGLHIKEIMLCLSFIFMVYYLRRNYGIAAFIITLNLVLLFNLEAPITNELIITRALSTIGGAGLAVLAGFVLLPHWDRKWLPKHLVSAIQNNYDYFLFTFFSPNPAINWTRHKRSTEATNSNAFDSFSRYMQEPGTKKMSKLYYQLITHNVRITRELNNIHLDEENKQAKSNEPASAQQQEKIDKCLFHFNRNMQLIHNFDVEAHIRTIETDEKYHSPFYLTEYQLLSLDKLTLELQEMYDELEQLAAAK